MCPVPKSPLESGFLAFGQVLRAALPASGKYGALLGGHGANRRYGFAFLI